MDVSLNPRENGACPLCSRLQGCRIREALRDAVADMRPARPKAVDSVGTPLLEIVVYSCPQFKEKP